MITTRNDGTSIDVVVACDEYALVTANNELVDLRSDFGRHFQEGARLK